MAVFHCTITALQRVSSRSVIIPAIVFAVVNEPQAVLYKYKKKGFCLNSQQLVDAMGILYIYIFIIYIYTVYISPKEGVDQLQYLCV